MGQPVRFTVPGDVHQLSPNRRLHYLTRAVYVKEWREKAFLCWMQQTGSVRFHRPVRISFHVRRRRLIDEDNLAASGALKAIVDALRDAPWSERMIRDDSPRWVKRGTVTQEVSRGRPEVEVIVEEIE